MKSDKYVIQYCLDEPGDNPDAIYEIGRVMTNCRRIAIITYCKNIFEKNKQHTCIVKGGAYSEFEIQLDDLYYPLMKNNRTLFEALVMHEIGHLVNGDFEEDESPEHAMGFREFIVRVGGMADEKEKLADRFAVEHCGKNAVMKYLDYVIKTRKERGYDETDTGIMELELRKNAVKKL